MTTEPVRVASLDDDASEHAAALENAHDRLAATGAGVGGPELVDQADIRRQLAGADCVLATVHTDDRDGLDRLDAAQAARPDLPCFVVCPDANTGSGASSAEGTDPAVLVAGAIDREVTDWFRESVLENHPAAVAGRIVTMVDRRRGPGRGFPPEDREQSLLEGCPDAIAVVADGRFEYVNAATVDLLGATSREALLGRPVDTVLHPDESLDALVDPEPGDRDDRVVTRAEFKLMGLDGTVINASVTARSVDWNGQPSDLAVLHDVTHRVRRRRALKRRTDRLERILRRLEGTYVWMATADQDRLLYLSPGFGPLRDRVADRDDAGAEVLLEDIHPDDRERVAALHERMRRDAERGAVQDEYEVEFRIGEPDGWVRWLSSSVFPVRDAGEVTRWVGVGTDVTTRKQRERELERSRRRYRTLVEQFPNGIVSLFDADGRYQLAGGRGFEELDVSAADLEGRTPADVFPPENAEVIEPLYRRAFEGESNTVELTLEDRVFRIQVVPVRDEDGSVFAGMTVSQDVTEQKAYERELRERDAHLRQAQAIADIGSWDLDIETGELDWSEECYRIFGIPSGEPVSYERFLERVHPDDRDDVDEEWTAALAGRDYDIEHRILVDGETRWVRERAVVEFDDAGDPERGIGVVQDVTDRKERERELEAARKRYQTLLRAAPDPIFVADAETGQIVEANAAAAELRSQPRDELVGLHQSALHQADDELAHQLFEEHVREGGTRRRLPNGELIQVTTAGGDAVPVEISAESVELTDRTVILGIFRDISEQLAFERELAGLHAATNEVVQASSTAEAARHIVDAMAEVGDLPAAAVYLYDDGDGALRPAAVSAGAERLVGEPPVFEPGDSIAWRVYTTGEAACYDDVRTDDDVHNPDTPVRSELLVPLGEHGLLLAGDPDPGAFDGHERELAEVLAASAEAALDSVAQKERLRRRERELEQQTRALDRVNQLNAAIRGINRTLVDADAPDVVLQAVCDRTVESGLIDFAWVAEPDLETDGVRPAAWSGPDPTYLDAIDPANDGNGEPTVEAAGTRSSVHVENVAERVRSGTWQTAALQRGYRSVLAVPIAYDGTFYGVLGVYTAERGLFDEPTRDVLVELGELVGLGLNAIDRRDALLGQRRTAVEFRLEGAAAPSQPFARLAEELGGRVEVSTVLPRDGRYLVYARLDGASGGAVESAVEGTPRIERVRRVGESARSGPGLFEFVAAGECLMARIAEQGARPRSVTYAERGGRVVAELPPTKDPSSLEETLQTAAPGLDLAATSVEHESVDVEEVYLMTDALTDAQREAVAAAYAAGYFEWPRDSNSEAVATALGISQPAFSQRMRAALGKLVGAYVASR